MQQHCAPPNEDERWGQEREAHWRAQQHLHQPPMASHERAQANWEQQHYPTRYPDRPTEYHDERPDGRPPAPRAHSFPPPRPGASPSVSHPGRMSAPVPPSSHINSYHPYAPPAKKALLFINTVPPSEAPASTKPKRKRILPEQLTELCALFDSTDSPSFEAREKVATAVGMTNREVQVWFQNRRAKVNRERAAAQEANQAKPQTSPRDPAPPLASFTSRFAAANSHDEQPSGIGEQAWRFRQEPRSVMAAPPAQDYRPHPPAFGGPPLQRPPLITRRSHPNLNSHHRQIFEQQGGRAGIDIPSPQQYLHPSPQPAYRSPHAPQYSPSGYTPSFFGMPSPSMSSSYGSSVSQIFTPNPGSAYSASSGYFSHPSETPYSPNGPFQSPSGTFLRLSIDSPQHPGFSPRSLNSAFHEQHSPVHPSDPLIHLPPLVSPRAWSNMQAFGERREQEQERAGPRPRELGHQRSQSESAADATRLAPMRPSCTEVPPNTSQPTPSSSLPASPANSSNVHPALAGRPSSSPQPSRSTIQQRRRLHPRPTSLSYTSSKTTEQEGAMGPPTINVSSTSAPGVEEGVGLGMLAMAGEMVEDEDDSEKEARQRYVATRKLSYGALRDQAGKEVEMAGI